jgi:hypothetical protein
LDMDFFVLMSVSFGWRNDNPLRPVIESSIWLT